MPVPFLPETGWPLAVKTDFRETQTQETSAIRPRWLCEGLAERDATRGEFGVALCRACHGCYRDTMEGFDIHEHDDAAVDHGSFSAFSRGKPGLVGARRSAAVRDDGSGKDGDGEGVRRGRGRNDHHGVLLPWCGPVRFVYAP